MSFSTYRFKKLISMSLDIKVWVGLLKWRPFSLTAYQMVKQLHLTLEPINTIIDGGANIGQFARAASEFFPDAMIYSFEPLPEIATSFDSNLSDRDNVILIQSAVGNRTGKQVFYRNEYDQASSALSLKTQANDIHSNISTIVDELEVSIDTLDNFDSQYRFEQAILIKLDLQGYELNAMQGADQLLNRTKYVLLEIAIVSVYENEPDSSEIRQFLSERGFKEINVLNRIRDKKGNDIQVDVLFENSAMKS